MKTLLFSFLAIAIIVLFTGAAGDVRKAIMTDTNGNVITTPLTFSNQFTMTIAATTASQVVRYQETTNAATAPAVLTNGNQVINGIKTFNGAIIVNGGCTNNGAFIFNGTTTFTNTTLHLAPVTISNDFKVTGVSTFNGIVTNNGAVVMTNTVLTKNGIQVDGLFTATNTAISRPHIALSCTNNQVNAGTTVSNVVSWTQIEDSYLITTNGTHVVIPQPGSYLCLISTILKNGATEGGNANVWVRLNGTNLVRSGTAVVFPSVSGGGVVTNVTMVVAVPVLFEVNSANEYVELLWWSDNATVTSPYTPAGTGPPRPESPSTIMTIEKSSR